VVEYEVERDESAFGLAVDELDVLAGERSDETLVLFDERDMSRMEDGDRRRPPTGDTE
jgi:hypothetical protein